MDESDGPAAPASGSETPTFEELAADPEIAALLDFDPAPRKVERPDGWTPERQRELIARIAVTGSPGKAVDQMDKNLSGAKHLYRTEGADSFREAWKAAITLAAERRCRERAAAPPRPAHVPGIARGRPKSLSPLAGEGGAGFQAPPDGVRRNARGGRGEGEVRNEFGEYEDAESLRARAEEAR
ncbi:MAG TPA: hypothetical protein VJM15_09025, partial [Sphingomicrobium sp.]|nr:hypothetical protein [Sphingomicrobium sp.]